MKHIFFILFYFISIMIFPLRAQNSRVFEEYRNSYASVNQAAKVNPEEILVQYRENTIPVDVKIDLYKKIFSASDLKNWSPELKSVILYQLIETDKTAQAVPGYLLMEKGYGEFISRIQEIMKREFAFVEEWKAEYKKELEEKGYSEFSVELDEELKNKAIHQVYLNMLEKVEDVEKYKF